MYKVRDSKLTEDVEIDELIRDYIASLKMFRVRSKVMLS